VGRDSLVDIATCYGLEGRESNPGGWTHPNRQWGLVYNRYRVFPGGKPAQGVALTTDTYVAPGLLEKEEYSYTSTPSLGLRGLL